VISTAVCPVGYFFLPGPYPLGCIPNVLGGVSWPILPETTVSDTVTTFAELETAVGVNGNLITLQGATTFTGNLTVTASDLDIIIPNDSTIDGLFQFGTGGSRVARIRVTGGNMTTGPLDLDNAQDILFDNFHGITDGAHNNFTGSRFDRVALINTTLEVINPLTTDDWPLFMSPVAAGHHTDLILANVNLQGGLAGQTDRIQKVVNTIIVDSIFNANGNASNGLRMHKECANALIRDTTIVKGILLNETSDAHGVINFVGERVTTYGALAFFGTHDPENTGTLNDSDSHRTGGTPGQEISIDPFTGTNNLIIGWDGVSFPSAAGIGADH